MFFKLGTLVLIFLITTTSVSGVFHPEVHASSFCYDDPSCDASTWGGLCKSGHEQSPINIEIMEDSEFDPTVFTMNDHYLLERTHKFFAQNNGHTAQFQLRANNSNLKSHLTICGGELTHCYKLAQFHFHWAETDDRGSEHTVMGRRYPLELHLVHYKSIYSSLAEALATKNDREAVAVMAVFYQVGERSNNQLTSIIEALHSIREPGEVQEFHLSLKVSKLYPSARNRGFARYFGSLTTPTCDEKVVWTVFLEPKEISEKQMKQFRKLSNNEGNSDFNFRPLQPLNKREIEFFRTEDFESSMRFSPWLTDRLLELIY